MFVFLVLLSVLAEQGASIKFYKSVGSMSSGDMDPSSCFKASPDFLCQNIDVCSKAVRSLGRMCNRRARRMKQLQNRVANQFQNQAQYDDPNQGQSRSPKSNPFFSRSLRNETYIVGSNISLNCEATGQPTPRVGISSIAGYVPLKYTPSRRPSREFRSTSSAVTYFNITRKHQGWYRCAAVNSKGSINSDVYITVVEDPCTNAECGHLKECVVEKGEAVCQCPKVEECHNKPLHPVCGNDCVSYFNLCTMRARACQTGTNVSIWLENQVCSSIQAASVESNVPNMKVSEGQSLQLRCGAKGYPHPDVAWYRVAKRGGGLTLVTKEDMLDLKNMNKDQSGKYLCMATNCLSHTVRSTTVDIEVSDPDVSDTRRVCHIFGDPHVTTFDGSMYSFVGACDYVLTMDCGHSPKWYVYGRIAPCGDDSSCLQSITAISEGTAIQFLRGWVVNNNGSRAFIAPGGSIKIGHIDIALDKDGLIFNIGLGESGVTVTWDGYSSATVIATKPMNSCGLCGSYDNDEGNDLTKSWFSGYYNNVQLETSEESQEVSSWKLDQWNMQCPQTVAVKGAPLTDTCETEELEQDVRRECTAFVDSTDAGHCIKSDDQMDFYIRACIRDTCGHDSTWAFCEFVESFIQHCEQETGISVDSKPDSCPNKSRRKTELLLHLL